jgi:cytosine deaminase
VARRGLGRLNRTVPPTHELVVADATLRSRAGRWQIGVDDGRITAVEQGPLSGREEIDAAGALVTESFANGHLHLDKVYTLVASSTTSTTFHLTASLQKENA